MKALIISVMTVLVIGAGVTAQDQGDAYAGEAFELRRANVTYVKGMDMLVFSQTVGAGAGSITPEPNGQINGAPVLGHVFPTTLAPEDVGFHDIEGVVSLAVTHHPDFDDTALWDENNDGDYLNDGGVWHAHWVILVGDERVPGGLSVAHIGDRNPLEVLPPTNAGMPMYMDSPGYAIVFSGRTVKVLVPAQRINHNLDFRYDAVTAFMRVDTSGEGPMLGVYQVYDILSGDLSLPYQINRCAF